MHLSCQQQPTPRQRAQKPASGSANLLGPADPWLRGIFFFPNKSSTLPFRLTAVQTFETGRLHAQLVQVDVFCLRSELRLFTAAAKLALETRSSVQVSRMRPTLLHPQPSSPCHPAASPRSQGFHEGLLQLRSGLSRSL